MITAIVLTKNEEENINKCLASISWADEIMVIDDNSTDGTVETAGKQGATVLNRALDNDWAFQRNFGLEKAKGEWVLFVDADEVITPELAGEIKTAVTQQNFSGYFIKRQDFFLGKWLRHGETGSIKLLRLAKKEAGVWLGKVHEVWKVNGRTSTLINPLLHYPHPTIHEFLSELNRYSSLRAWELHDQGKHAGVSQIIFYPLSKFLINYLIKLGFLDGEPGFIMAMFMSLHSFLVRSKLYLLDRGIKGKIYEE